MRYLLIQNKGEAPIEGYTVLGYSSTRNCGVDGAIGQFGSGAKHAINLCLRNGLPVWVYCGRIRLRFSLEKEVINDGLRDDVVYHVVYRKDNGNFKRAGWVLDFGVLDWDNVGMGLRELISNAIDRTIKESDLDSAYSSGDLAIKIVDDKDRRAKSGYTRIYVSVNDEVREYFGNLHKNFLHFSDTPEQANPCLIRKDSPSPARIYRCGVFVRELHENSIFDYNFSANEIEIDECRNSSSYAVKAACARKIQDADSSQIADILSAQLVGQSVIESSFDEDYLTGFNSLTETQAARWQSAWDAAAGPESIVCESEFSKDYAEKKGHKAQIVTPSWTKALKRAGVRTAYDVLSIDEQRGRVAVETTYFAQEAVNWAWELFEMANIVGNREKPQVFCFKNIGSCEAQTNGYCNNEGVHIHIDIANNGLNNELKKTALEEVAHWITGSTDNSRDFQNFFIDAIVALA